MPRRLRSGPWSLLLIGACLVLAPAGDDVDALRAAPLPHAAGAPPGRTGGFGEPTCRECHDEFELGVGGRLNAEGLPSGYEPGATYAVTLVLESGGMVRAGFQAAFRTLAGGPAGSVAPVGETVAVRAGEGGLVYLQHAPGAVATVAGEVASWPFTWTAPQKGAGPVAFHAAANSANGDDSPFGDIVYVASDTVAPRTTPAR